MVDQRTAHHQHRRPLPPPLSASPTPVTFPRSERFPTLMSAPHTARAATSNTASLVANRPATDCPTRHITTAQAAAHLAATHLGETLQ